MSRVLMVLMVLGVLGFVAGCASEEDEESAMMAYMKAKAKETRLVMQKCREGAIDEVPITTKKSTLVSIKRTLTDTRVDTGFAKMDGNAGPVLKAELQKTYTCLIEDGVPLDATGTISFALEAGKADEDNGTADIPAGSTGVAAAVNVHGYGNASAAAVADSETVATVMGAVEEGAQGSINGLAGMVECFADIADCLGHVSLRNSWCMQNAHELNPGNAYCAEGCCSHTGMVGMIHCLPSCGAGWVEDGAFSQCENMTPADDGYCAWD